MPFILEGIVTTRNDDGTINVAPMGPIVDPAELPRITRLLLRPWQTSTTYSNLSRTRQGVFHVVDDVLLLARAAIGRLDASPRMTPATVIDGEVLLDACRWYEFLIESLDDSNQRVDLQAVVVHADRLRDYTGLNRARHAVLEAAILATRVHLLDRGEILSRLETLRSPVEKTAGPREREAFDLICRYVEEFQHDAV